MVKQKEKKSEFCGDSDREARRLFKIWANMAGKLYQASRKQVAASVYKRALALAVEHIASPEGDRNCTYACSGITCDCYGKKCRKCVMDYFLKLAK